MSDSRLISATRTPIALEPALGTPAPHAVFLVQLEGAGDLLVVAEDEQNALFRVRQAAPGAAILGVSLHQKALVGD